MQIILRLLQGISPSVSLGVISLYAAQCTAFHRKMGESPFQFSTVDAFQGNEKDVIVLSTVRSKTIGFTADPRRLNVAFTRARSQLIIVGNRDLLNKDALWRRVLSFIEEKGRILSPAELYRSLS